MKAVFKNDFYGLKCILKAVTHLSEKFFSPPNSNNKLADNLRNWTEEIFPSLSVV